MKKVIWAAAHTPTPEQIKELQAMGELVFLKDIHPDLFDSISNVNKDSRLQNLAASLLSIAHGNILVQPAGSPAFQKALGYQQAIMEIEGGFSYEIIYSFSQRVSEDIPQPDGTVKKVSTFKHEGWV